MSKLQEYFENNTANAMNKWMHYFDIYERHLSKYVGKEVVILEIGVFQGGSLKMWKEYFGEKVKIYAIDIFDKCKQFEDEDVKVFIGSQSDRDFLKEVKSQIPNIDILIDDGGHFMDQQIISFEELYSKINEDGIYVCEDLHTSYWKSYGGGFQNKNSFIEYSKNLIDQLNAWHSKEDHFKINQFTRSAYSMHYYDSVLVIEKKVIHQPSSKLVGNILINIDEFPENQIKHENSVESKTKFRNPVARVFKKLTR